MMGRQIAKKERLTAFSVDDYVPANHLLRQIDRFLELSALRQSLSGYYSAKGRPSIDPELMIRMLIIGYCYGIRSERRLCEEVHLNLAYRWFCRLGLKDPVPEHSTFSKNRHGRFRDSDAFRQLFETVLARCIAEGVVAGEGFAVDASTIAADASSSRNRSSHGNPDDWHDGGDLSRPVREYLCALEQANPGAPVTRRISLTDPAARWIGTRSHLPLFAYSTNYLVDLYAGIVVDVEATECARGAEVNSLKVMVDRVDQRFHLKPHRLVGDTAYGTSEMLSWMVHHKRIAPHVPVWDKTSRTDGTMSSSCFQFDAQRGRYICPQGHDLHTTGQPTAEHTILYRARHDDCANCARKPQCCPNTPSRKIARSIHEEARDVARALSRTQEYDVSRRQRKKVEVLFAHLKRILKLDRLRLRGLSGAHDEFLLAATTQNLRRLVKWLAPTLATGGVRSI